MSIFESSSTHFILLFLFGLLSLTSEADPIFVDSVCTNGTFFEPHSRYEANLDALLSFLTSNASLHDGFYRTTVAQGTPDVVSGLFLCRGDATPTICQDCVDGAAKETARVCSYETESIIWYDVCMLRYSNQSFNNIVPSVDLQDNTSIASADQGRFNDLLSTMMNYLTAKANSRTGKKFATAEEKFTSSQTLYGLAQCTPDLRNLDCNMCLRSAIGFLPTCCHGKTGARVLLPACNIRYELYLFYNVTETPSAPRSGRQKIVVVVVVSVVVAVILFGFAYCFLRSKTRKSDKAVLRENFGTESIALESLQFSLGTIEAATNKFSCENKIGKGGFGEVYKGTFLDGRQVAIKRLSRSSGQGAVEFKNEVLLIAKLQHRNLVTLLGFCLEEEEKILVYEYIPNNSLDYFLFGTQKRSVLNWHERYQIIEGIAQGILYLHKYSRLKIIHRDLKPSNILLDDNMNPKISDFGMAKIVGINEDQGSTNRVVGTFGYMSPEYAMLGQYSEKSDIFSFGVIVMEIISGRKNASRYESQYVDSLLSSVWKKWRDEAWLEILDPNLSTEVGLHSKVMKCIHIGLLCVQENPDARPLMVTVASYLSNDSIQLPLPQEPAFFIHGQMEPPIIEEKKPGASSNSERCSINEISMSIFCPR